MVVVIEGRKRGRWWRKWRNYEVVVKLKGQEEERVCEGGYGSCRSGIVVEMGWILVKLEEEIVVVILEEDEDCGGVGGLCGGADDGAWPAKGSPL